MVDDNFSLVLCDFGVSKDYKNRKDAIEFQSVGTLVFDSPEMHCQSQKGFDPFPCDIWSAGLIFYFMLFGKYTIQIQNTELFIKNLEEK